MLPFFEIGPWRVETAGVLYALAVLVAGAFYLVRLRRRRFRPGPSARALLWIVLGGGLGANLGGGLSLGYELLTGSPFPVPLKSVSFPGAMLGGTLAAWLICRHYRLSFWWACDQAIPALPLGQAIGQLGCLARGCCAGRPADSWPALYLPDRQGDWASRYPTHLVSAAADLLILALLLALDRTWRRDEGRARRDGLLTLLYVGLYLLSRLAVDFWRADALPPWIGPLNSTQVGCALGVLLAAAVAAHKLWRTSARRMPSIQKESATP